MINVSNETSETLQQPCQTSSQCCYTMINTSLVQTSDQLFGSKSAGENSLCKWKQQNKFSVSIDLSDIPTKASLSFWRKLPKHRMLINRFLSLTTLERLCSVLLGSFRAGKPTEMFSCLTVWHSSSTACWLFYFSCFLSCVAFTVSHGCTTRQSASLVWWFFAQLIDFPVIVLGHWSQRFFDFIVTAFRVTIYQRSIV